MNKHLYILKEENNGQLIFDFVNQIVGQMTIFDFIK